MNRDLLLRDTFVQEVLWLEEVDSTNSLALTLDETVPLPVLIGAERQRAGRGRGANTWWAAPGALTFSLVIEPKSWNIPREDWPALSLTTALAVCDAIEQQVPPLEPLIKWPNDVLIGGKKVCGILIETVPDAPDRLVLGMGVNVNNSLSGAPPVLQRSAAALTDLVSAPLDRTLLLMELLQSLDRRLRELGSHDPQLAVAWRRHCLLTGCRVVIQDAGGRTEGRCEGIDADAALRVRTPGGLRRLFSGTVQEYGSPDGDGKSTKH